MQQTNTTVIRSRYIKNNKDSMGLPTTHTGLYIIALIFLVIFVAIVVLCLCQRYNQHKWIHAEPNTDSETDTENNETLNGKKNSTKIALVTVHENKTFSETQSLKSNTIYEVV
eukprot:28310_1